MYYHLESNMHAYCDIFQFSVYDHNLFIPIMVSFSSRYCVMGGTPSFIIVVDGSKFMKEFLSKYK